MLIKSNCIVSENGIVDGYMEVKDGKITRIFNSKEPQSVDIDYGNQRVLPGVFDTHNHGTKGYTLMKGVDEKEVKGYLKGLASQGVTSIFPTCEVECIKTVAKVAKEQQDGAKILGIHSEGPWLNRVGEKGIHTGWPKVDREVARKMITDSDGLLRLVALAPEIPGMDEIMEVWKENNITMAIAHSDLPYEQTNEAIDNGIEVATHLGNVMTGLHHRDIGVFGACLLRDEVTCELIADGLHISLPMIEIILKVKDHDKIMLISDCTPMSGAPIGRYKGFGEGMEFINVDDEGFVLSDTGRLCGSSQGVIYGIYNFVEKLGIPLEETVKMSSLTACKKYGFDKTKGSLKEGKDADFIVINDQYQVLYTYSEGRKVYDYILDKEVFNPLFLEENRC